MTLVLVAHGTRDPAGVRVIDDLAALVRLRLPGVRVEVAFADVCEPTVDSVLRRIDGPAVVVPAFLASGYHVRTDLPAQVDGRAVITPPLGPAPTLVAVAHDRLLAAGWRPGTPVILAAAGSTDPRAGSDVRRAAILLSLRLGAPVQIGYLTTTSPRLRDIVERSGARAVASWLLAPGLFHRSAQNCGAPIVAAPLGPRPGVADLIARRYIEARCYSNAA
jgi:sirohydrochlorin ferrochelatase